MLSGLTVSNFKSLAEVDLPLSTLNVLIGENGSGKSSILQALALLKQSLGNNGLRLSGALLDLGTFQDVLHRGAASGADMGFAVRGFIRLTSPLAVGTSKASAVKVSHDYSASEQSLSRLTASYELDGLLLEARWNPITGGVVQPQQVTVSGITVGLGVTNVIGGGIQLSSITGSSVEPSAQRQAVAAVNMVLAAGQTILTNVFVVPSVRGIERQSYDLGEGPSAEFGSSEGSLKVAQALATTLAYRRELEDKISSWMMRVTGRGLQGRVLPPRRVSLNAVAHGYQVNMANEGFGSNQLAHVLTQLAQLPPQGLLAIEEPEIHLHPAAQSRLVTVLVESIRAAESQLLITTHSEHILYALMALVAEGTLKPGDVFVHHVSNESGATVLRRLELDTSGRIAGGLPGFFDVHVEEFRRFLDASEKRQ